MRYSAFLTIFAALAVLLASHVPASAQAPAARGYYDFYAQDTVGEPWEALLGRPAPDVKLELLSGGTFDLSAYKGKKVVVMDFWATWCPPCRVLMPIFAEVAKTYKDKDVVFFAINQAEPIDRVNSFIQMNKFDFPVALDKEGNASVAYKVNTIPRLVMVAKDGTVQSVHAGLEGRDVKSVQENARKRISSELDKLLAGEKLVQPAPSQPTQEAKSTTSDKS